MSTDITHEDVLDLAAALQGATAQMHVSTQLAEHLHEYLLQVLDHPFHVLFQLIISLEVLFKKIVENTSVDLNKSDILEKIEMLLKDIRAMVRSVVSDHKKMQMEANASTRDMDAESDVGSMYMESLDGGSSDDEDE